MSWTAAWVGIGFIGQALFSMRFIYQWFHSERAKRSVIPEAFWYFSIAGGATLLAYAIHREDPVFIVGQAAGLLIYARNIYFIQRDKRQAAIARAGGDTDGQPTP
jgi:lipid-A-disaccharide synthase-like uncharacterized protein